MLSNTRSLLNELREHIERLYMYGEVVAGSEAEKRLANEIRLQLEDYAEDVRLLPVKVLCWEDLGALVESEGKSFSAATLPPTIGGEAEGKLVKVECPFPRCFEHVSEGDIVLVELPEDPDDVAAAYLSAVEKGASALIVYDRWPSRRRRVVVVGKWSYTPYDPAPAILPAVHLRREEGLELIKSSLGKRVRLTSNVCVRPSTGYIVEALICPKAPEAGSGDWEVLITAHHDHWLGGANDNLSGVASLIVLAKKLRELKGPGRVRLVSFTAEEFGDPMQPSWYWSYGSRHYAEQLRKVGLLDNVVAVLNLDAAGSPRMVVNVTGYELRSLLEGAASRLGIAVDEWKFDSSYTDSFSFSRLGVPSASIVDINGWIDKYHTDLDTPSELSYENLAKAVKLVYEVCKLLVSRGPQALDYKRYAQEVYRYVIERKSSLEVVRSAYRLLREVDYAVTRNDYEGLLKAFRVINAKLVKPVFKGDYRVNSGEFETVLMPQLEVAQRAKEAARMLRRGELDEAAKLCSEQVIIPWDGRVLSMPLRCYVKQSHLVKQLTRLRDVMIEQLISFARTLESEVSSVLDEAYLILLSRRVKS